MPASRWSAAAASPRAERSCYGRTKDRTRAALHRAHASSSSTACRCPPHLRSAGPAGGRRRLPRRGKHRGVFRLPRPPTPIVAAHRRGPRLHRGRSGPARLRRLGPISGSRGRPERRVALAYGAVEKILGANPRGAGLFLLGHSAGCELAVRMAADERAEHAASSASNWPVPDCSTPMKLTRS